MLYENKYFKFYLFFILFLLYICFYRTNLIIFYFFFESILFPIIIIIFNWGNQPERLQAGIYILIYTLFGSLPLFIIIFIFKDYRLNYLYIEFLKFKTIGLLFFLIMLGFLVKVPMFFTSLITESSCRGSYFRFNNFSFCFIKIRNLWYLSF